MTVSLTFLGGAGTVTGSKFLLDRSGARTLAREIKLLGTYVRVRAEVVVDETFSVHADASELASWLQAMPEPPQTVYVVHGEPAARTALAERIRRTLDCAVVVPRLGERVLLT